MIRRLLCACVGAAFMCVLAVPARAGAKPPDLPEDGTFTLAPANSPFAPFNRPQLVEKKMNSRCDALQLGMNNDVLKDVPREIGRTPIVRSFCASDGEPVYDRDWLLWIVAHWTTRQPPPPPEQNDGYLRSILTGSDFASQILYETTASDNETHRYLRSFNTGLDLAYQAVSDTTSSQVETSEHSVEVLPMPKEEPDVTCPYLRQQRVDRHACHMIDPEIGRDVLDNLKLLEEADHLLELAKVLAEDGYIDAAMECCAQAAELCPGSPCAARAAATQFELALGSETPVKESDDTTEQESETPVSTDADRRQMEYDWQRLWSSELPSRLTSETIPNHRDPGIQLMVSGLMRACHLMMDQGLQHQAAELARQAYALDPQSVMADPLIYKMHLLAESPAAQPVGASEESEPATCPYCPRAGKPIREIVPPKKKKQHADHAARMKPKQIESLPFEFVANTDGELRLNAEYTLGGNVYHLRYTQGHLDVWKTSDDSWTKP